MRIEKRATETKCVYVAKNGKQFESEWDCELYEKYAPATIYDILKKYCTIIKEEDIEEYKKNRVPMDSYIIINKKIPYEEERYCYEIGKNFFAGYLPNLRWESSKPTLFHSEKHKDGRWWIELGDKNYIESESNYWEKMLQKIFKTKKAN